MPESIPYGFVDKQPTKSIQVYIQTHKNSYVLNEIISECHHHLLHQNLTISMKMILTHPHVGVVIETIFLLAGPSQDVFLLPHIPSHSPLQLPISVISSLIKPFLIFKLQNHFWCCKICRASYRLKVIIVWGFVKCF